MATEPQPDDFADVRLTPTMRSYLGAFDDFLFAPTPHERQFARAAMSDICDDMMSEAGLPPRRDRAGAISSEDERAA